MDDLAARLDRIEDLLERLVDELLPPVNFKPSPDLNKRMTKLEQLGYRFTHHEASVSVMSPEKEPLGTIPLLIGDTACHRLLDQFRCPR